MKEEFDRQEFEALDDLIDRALESYTPSEPRVGLEGRILAYVRGAASGRWGWRGLWGWRAAWALAAAAAMLAVVIPVWQRLERREVAVVRPAVSMSERASAVAVNSKEQRQVVHEMRTTATVETGERVIAGVSEITPVRIAPLRNEPMNDEAIEIKPIAIAPIRIGALN